MSRIQEKLQRRKARCGIGEIRGREVRISQYAYESELDGPRFSIQLPRHLDDRSWVEQLNAFEEVYSD